MEQLMFELGFESEVALPLRHEARRRQEVVALMADAILAVVESKEEDNDERDATQR